MNIVNTHPGVVFTTLFSSLWAQKARVLHYNRLGGLASTKHSNLLGQFVSYKENEYCEYRTQG
jgi:hypothetical protein